MLDQITFLLDGKLQSLNFKEQNKYSPTTTVLQYLRSLPNHKGVKEGCAEGDCGACTIVLAELDVQDNLHYQAVNSCLLFLPKLQGKQLITIENLKDDKGNLHPVQKTVAEKNGSQCGFCTPGIVMSLFGHYKNNGSTEREAIEDTLSGNLCRCTGYQPILDAGREVMATISPDQFSQAEKETVKLLKSVKKEYIMLQTDHQKYFLPVSLKELLQLKAENPKAILLGGSTDVALRVTKKNELLPEIIDISLVDELKQVHQANDKLITGSQVSLNHLMELTKNSFPAIHKICKTFGSSQIRNLATIGGNLGSASPIGDLAPVLMAYNAEVIVESKSGQRKLNINDFITGYRQTALQKDEIIRQIEIIKPIKNTIVAAYKISKRYDLDIATVSAGFRIELDENKMISDCCLAYGGMAASTSRAAKAEEFLTGKQWNRSVVEETMPLIRKSFKPISDARSGAEYRSLAAANLLLKFWQENQ